MGFECMLVFGELELFFILDCVLVQMIFLLEFQEYWYILRILFWRVVLVRSSFIKIIFFYRENGQLEEINFSFQEINMIVSDYVSEFFIDFVEVF